MTKLFYAAIFLMMPVVAFAEEATTVTNADSTAMWYLIGAACVSFASSLLSALIPMPAEGSFWVIPRKILDFLASNIFNAKNAK